METDSLIGRQLGQYEICGQIVVGNLSEVYEARQPALKRSVCVVVLKPVFRAQAAYVDAFLRSAEIMAGLEHPHIVPIYDFGREDDLVYTVHRLLTGGTLEDRLEAGSLSLQETSTILKQIAGALEFTHSHGMTHGNPTPGNIRFDEGNIPYLLNFMNVGPLRSKELVVKSTPTYIAPERWSGASASPAADQYALGSIVYEMLTGKPTFSDTGTQLSSEARFEVPPQMHNRDIPLAVNDVLSRAMARRPDDRYPTVMDFARDFERAIQSVPKHLFISYSRRDREYAQGLTEHFQNNGFEVWIDARIEYGTQWFKEIDEAIKTCAAFVVVMTPDAYDSKWVEKEILLAEEYKKPIFPLLLKGERFPITVNIQFADVRDGQMPQVDFHRRLARAVFGDG